MLRTDAAKLRFLPRPSTVMRVAWLIVEHFLVEAPDIHRAALDGARGRYFCDGVNGWLAVLAGFSLKLSSLAELTMKASRRRWRFPST